MAKKEDHKMSNDALALEKVTAWTCYRCGSGFENLIVTEGGDHIVTRPWYKRETMEKAQENILASTHYPSTLTLRTNYVGSSLLDVYEIERISKELDRYIESSRDKYYHRKSVDAVCDPSGRRSVSSRMERDYSGIRVSKTSREVKWFGFRVISKLCGSTEGGVAENVQVSALKQGRKLELV
ncbi:hypothetical protein QVD17_05126 [Tagetes erecta]|uniref:Uncharacterized protein n=1 Tax=Tagetes erecta TaxID=13708 RepID=A0AAD8LBE3_TARER|nr:hypothetical protein QVD17_05126 [Tagetes erecta]